MVEKTKTNEYGDVVFSEEDAIELLYSNPNFDISHLFLKETKKYNTALKDLGIDLPPLKTCPENHISIEEFDRSNIERWFMPAQYKTIDVEEWLLQKCTSDQERQRVDDEIILFKKKNFIKVLQFLIYFVDRLRANNIVWGVGRGSSVASFCLFLIGVHKINPLLYDLDIKEFLR